MSTQQHGYPPGPDRVAQQWFWRFLVHSIQELEAFLFCKRSYCSEITHNVFSKNHKAIVERMAQLALRVTKSIPGYTAWEVNR